MLKQNTLHSLHCTMNVLLASARRLPAIRLHGHRQGLDSPSKFFSTTSDELPSTVYVHPLSQIVLEYFQGERSDWIIERGLDRSLKVHRDGSFEIKFEPRSPESNSRVWTSYDDIEKKHWLVVHKGELHQRYLLQDNLLPAWHGNRKSLPERIHVSVEEMIRAIDQSLDSEVKNKS
jgi:hypothetical protein